MSPQSAFSSKKKLSGLNPMKYAQIKHRLQVKTVQNSSKQICGWILMWEKNRRWTFSLAEADYGLWIHILTWSIWLFLTNTVFHFTGWTGVVWIICGLLWCFYQLFGLSFWRHPFTAEDPLVIKLCNNTFLQICSYKETNYHLEWPEGTF